MSTKSKNRYCSSLLKRFTLRNVVAEVWDREGSYKVSLYAKRGMPRPTPLTTGEVLMFTGCSQANTPNGGPLDSDLDDIITLSKRAKKFIKESMRSNTIFIAKQMIADPNDPEEAAWARRTLASLNRRSA